MGKIGKFYFIDGYFRFESEDLNSAYFSENEDRVESVTTFEMLFEHIIDDEDGAFEKVYVTDYDPLAFPRGQVVFIKSENKFLVEADESFLKDKKLLKYIIDMYDLKGKNYQLVPIISK